VLPDVPSVAEAGVPSYEAVNWWGIVAPAGTPQPIIDKVHAALTAAQDSPEPSLPGQEAPPVRSRGPTTSPASGMSSISNITTVSG